MSRRPAVLPVVLALLLQPATAPAAGAAGGVAPAVTAAERTADLLERDDTGAVPTYPPDFTAPTPEEVRAHKELDATARALDAHLESAPRDARGLVARARLMRHQAILAAYEALGRGETDVVGDAPILETLDRALALDSTRSEAWYFKGLTLATSIGFAPAAGLARFEPALPFARRAHAARPDDPRRIALLERCLLGVGEDLEAERVRDPAAGEGGQPSPVARIVERRETVPAPPGLRSEPGLREHLGLLVQKKPGDRTFASAYARARRFQGVAVPVDSILAFYSARWPGLQWTDQRLEPEPRMMHPTTRFAQATLLWVEGSRWVPAGADVIDPHERDDTLLLIVEETDLGRMRDALPPEALAALPDSVRAAALPATTNVTLFDRVGMGR